MTNVDLTNLRINLLDKEDGGYTIYLVVEGYGVFVIENNSEAHLVIEKPNIYAMHIRLVWFWQQFLLLLYCFLRLCLYIKV